MQKENKIFTSPDMSLWEIKFTAIESVPKPLQCDISTKQPSLLQSVTLQIIHDKVCGPNNAQL